MYYNRITRVFVLDMWDYFFLSAIAGNFIASYLKKYLSEKKALNRLKRSIISKSGLVSSKTPVLSKNKNILKVYGLALNHRGGQLEDYECQVPNEMFQLAQSIEKMVERLAAFLHERKLRGILRIFASHGKLILELILCKCNIDITYIPLTQELPTQVIVITATTGGALGFTVSWLSTGAALVFPPLLISTLLIRSFTQQVLNQLQYLKFKETMKQLLNDKTIRNSLVTIFEEVEVPLDFDTNPPLRHNFNLKSDQNLEQFLKENFGLINEPTEVELQEIIETIKNKQSRTRPRGKAVYFKDLIMDSPYDDEPLDFIDPEIVEQPQPTKPIRVQN